MPEAKAPASEPAAAPDPAPAPAAEGRDARATVVADQAEKRLATKGATPEEIAKARERIQRRSEAARPDAPQAPRERTAPDAEANARKSPAPDKPAEKRAGTEPPKDAPPRSSKGSSAGTTRDPLLEPSLVKEAPPRFGAISEREDPAPSTSHGKWVLKEIFERASAP